MQLKSIKWFIQTWQVTVYKSELFQMLSMTECEHAGCCGWGGGDQWPDDSDRARDRGRGETEPRMSRHWPALSPLLTSERSGETPHVTDTGGMNYEWQPDLQKYKVILFNIDGKSDCYLGKYKYNLSDVGHFAEKLYCHLDQIEQF